jgi:hypothetical protein
MYLLLYVVLIFVQPLDSIEQEKMAAHLIKVNKKSFLYARPLVKEIYKQSKRTGIDPTVFAAIAWNESWFDKDATGDSHEKGIWQIWPWVGFLPQAWAFLRRKGVVVNGVRSVSWGRLSLKDRQYLIADLEVGTWFAADILSNVSSYCVLKKHDHRRPTDKYAHYNSGYKYPRPGYSRALWNRVRIMRAVIGRPRVTAKENAWLNRTVPGGL